MIGFIIASFVESLVITVNTQPNPSSLTDEDSLCSRSRSTTPDSNSKSKSKSKLCYDRRSVGQSILE
jgi:hypothetical protein